MYEALVTFLDAVILPDKYPNFAFSDGSWNQDTETKVNTQGLKATLSSFQTIAVFIITKNVLDEVKTLGAKLQKRDQDIYEAYMMVHEVICYWYQEILELAETIGVTESIPQKTSLIRHRCNTPS